MNNSSFHIPRHAVFAFAFVIAETLFMLSFPKHIEKALWFIMFLSLIIFFVLFISGRKTLAFLISVFISLGALSPYYTYNSKEKYSQDLLPSLLDKEHTYVGKVTHSGTSSKPVNARVLVKTIDGLPVEKDLCVQVTSFSDGNVIENSFIEFTGFPCPVSETEKGEFDTQSYLKSKNTFIVFPNAKILYSKTDKSINIIRLLQEKFQKTIYTYVKHNNDLNKASIVSALVLGDRDSFTKDMSNSFSKSGMTHLMCVSGLHFSVILGMIFSILSFLTINKKFRCILLILFCVFYIFFTGASQSVIRAGLMSCFTYIAMLIGRKSDSIIALFATGAFMVIVQPYIVFDISARLSFCATLGVIVTVKTLDDTFSVFSKNHPKCFGFLSALATNIGAVAFTTPIGADYFGSFSTVSVFSTLCSSFICEILIILSNLLCLLSLFPLSSGICKIIGKFCFLLSKFIISISDFFASLSYSYVEAFGTHTVIIIFLVFIAVLSFSISIGSSKGTKIIVSIILSSSLIFSFISIRQAIIQNNALKVSYYRKNEDDRQLGVKLGTFAHIIFNADNNLCTNPEQAMFDDVSGNNFLVIVPDQSIEIPVLANNISTFDSAFSLKGILVPNTDKGREISNELLKYGINCKSFFGVLEYKNYSMNFSNPYENTYFLSVSDEKEELFVVFSDKYSVKYFEGHSDICAYFTRKTKNQFFPDKYVAPSCKTFITRTKNTCCGC